MRSLFALSACVFSAAVELRLDGVPVLKVVTFSQTRSVEDAFADVRGQLTWTGDIDAPTDAEWHAS